MEWKIKNDGDERHLCKHFTTNYRLRYKCVYYYELNLL